MTIETTTPRKFLRPADAADFLQVSPRTLEGWRLRNRGPRYVRTVGAIRYPLPDLIAFLERGEQEGGGQ